MKKTTEGQGQVIKKEDKKDLKCNLSSINTSNKRTVAKTEHSERQEIKRRRAIKAIRIKSVEQ